MSKRLKKRKEKIDDREQQDETDTPFIPPDIELIKALKSLEEIQSITNLPQTEFQGIRDQIIKRIKRPKEHIEPSLEGLKLEDEFKLILLLIADLDQITPLEQRQIVERKKYITPDFLVKINIPKVVAHEVNTKKLSFYLEVKKAQKDSKDFNIPIKEFNKLNDYCTSYNFPLFFVIKFDNIFSKWWYLIPGTVLKTHSSVKKMKIKNRRQMVYYLPLTEVIKLDFSGMLLNNYTVMLPEGTKISKTYNTELKNGMKFHPERGVQTTHSIMNDNDILTFDLLNNDDGFKIITQSSVLETLSLRNPEKKVKNNQIEIIHTIEDTTFFPYYLIVLDCFLHIRSQFQSIFKEESQSLSYYVNRYSQVEVNLSKAIQSEIFFLEKKGFIKTIRMLPSISLKKVLS